MIQDPNDDRGIRHETYLYALRDLAHAAAVKALPIVIGLAEVNSVLDIGCGPGAWLTAAGELGVERRVGVDGSWAMGWISPTAGFEFVVHDLELPLPELGSFDLGLALGVVEFLQPSRVDGFIADLCKTAGLVLFSSSVPYQPRNAELQQTQEWPSWWREKFAVHGFRPLDIVRPEIWVDNTVPWWYRQGLILYADETVHPELFSGFLDERHEMPALDVVHPELFVGIASGSFRSKPLPQPRSWLDRLRHPGSLARAVVRRTKRRFTSARK